MEFYLAYHDENDSGGRFNHHAQPNQHEMSNTPRGETPSIYYYEDQDPPPESLRPPICKRVSWHANTRRFASCDSDFTRFSGLPTPYLQNTTWAEFSLQASTWLITSSRARAMIETSTMKLRENTRKAVEGQFNKDSYVFPVGPNLIHQIEVLIMALHDEVVWLIFDTGMTPALERLQRTASAPALKNFSFTSLNESLAMPREKKPRRKRRPWDGAMTQFSLSGSDRGSSASSANTSSKHSASSSSSSSSSGSSGSSSRRPSGVPSRPDISEGALHSPQGSGQSLSNQQSVALSLEEATAAVVAQNAVNEAVAAQEPVTPAQLPTKPDVSSSSSLHSLNLNMSDTGGDGAGSSVLELRSPPSSTN